MRVPEGEEREKETERQFEEIVAKNLEYINQHILEAQKNSKIPRLIIVKPLKKKKQVETLESSKIDMTSLKRNSQ